MNWKNGVNIKVKRPGYSLYPVMLLCWLHNYPKSWGLFIPDSISTHWGALAHSTDQLTMPSFPSLYHFLLLRYEGAVEIILYDFLKVPTDRFSQDLTPWSSDHWYSTVTNSAKVAIRLCTYIQYRIALWVLWKLFLWGHSLGRNKNS